MFFQETAPFIKNFIEEVNASLAEMDQNYALTRLQRSFLCVCLMGILLTNSICWSKIMRTSLGLSQIGALSWMFRSSKIFWDYILIAGLKVILKKYKITNGVLALDDTDKPRSKNTTHIDKVHKIFDKKTSGYFKGQNMALLLLITEKVTIPVGFYFYEPDPALTEWKKNDEKLHSAGVPKKDRPEEPKRNPLYPSKSQIGITLIKEFKAYFPSIKINAIIADAFYGSKYFFTGVKNVYPKTQIISQLRCNQLALYRGKQMSLANIFKCQTLAKHTLSVRGKAEQNVWMHGCRLVVDAHGQRMYVIALKYEGEEESRYIVASDLGWRMKDVVETYSLRWLVEVFFQDWKAHEGWRELELQYVEGSKRAAILSLLFDYSLLLHPAQFRVVERKLPAYTVGSLIEQSKVDVFLEFVRSILESEDREKYLSNFESAAKEIFKLSSSEKHMSGKVLPTMKPTLQLQKRWEEKMAA